MKVQSVIKFGTLQFAAAIIAVTSICGEPASAESKLESLRSEGLARIAIGNEPPYSQITADGEVTGAAPDVTRAVLKKLGIPEVKAVVADYGAMIPGLQANRFDLAAAGLFMKPERCEGALFSQPDVCGAEGLLVKKGNPLGIKGHADIAANPDFKVGICGGCVAEKYTAEAGVKRSQIVVVPDVPSALKMVQDGRIQAYSNTALGLHDIIKKTSATDVEVVAPAANTPVACAGAVFSRSDVEFRDAYDKALQELKDSGEFDAILAKYGFSAEAAKITTRDSLCGGPNP
jgi:polar amino acid transport system substrate-binding protein